MELRHLRYFVAVAEELHFGRAALRLRTAQSSLSAQIRDLEAEVGVRLLSRTKRQVHLTDAGRAFLAEAQNILKQAENGVRLARRADRGELGRLGIGFVPSADCISFPEILRVFKKRAPRIEIVLRNLSAIEQLAALRQGEIDIGFLRPPGSDPTIQSETIIREPFVVAVPKGHPLAKAREVAVKELHNEPLLLCSRQHAALQHDSIITMFRSADVVPRILFETDHIQTILGLVAAGIGISLLPASVENLRAPGLAYRRIKGAGPHLEMAVAFRRSDPSQVLAQFLTVVREFARRQFKSPGAGS